MADSDTATFLRRERQSILRSAGESLGRMHARHYESAGAEAVRERLGALFDQLVDGVEKRDLGAMIAFSRRIAQERYEAGYDLSEVQVAFNALEEASWTRVLADVDPSQLAEALGLIGTVLGAGKDALAREYVSLAADTRAPSLDLTALFAGTD
jgi:hypothetical protein